MRRRTGVLGGSFNPIHYGHLLLADEVLELLPLDRVLFVPAGAPPHKPARSIAPAADRLAMVQLAVAGHPRFAASDLELRRPGPSYTVDTLDALAAADEELCLVLGSEMFLDLPSWREPRRIVALARLCVIPRAGSGFDPESPAAQEVLAALRLRGFARAGTEPSDERTVRLVPAMSLPISASDLRRRVREGRSVAYRAPDAVLDYIRAHGLYRDDGAASAAAAVSCGALRGSSERDA